jgi:uncharacterized lipoprotein YbaY
MKMCANSRGCRVILLVALSWLTACGSGQEAVTAGSQSGDGAMSKIEGTVFYRERMMLPPGAEVEVLVRRVAEQVQRDAPALDGQVWSLQTLSLLAGAEVLATYQPL